MAEEMTEKRQGEIALSFLRDAARIKDLPVMESFAWWSEHRCTEGRVLIPIRETRGFKEIVGRL